MCSVSELFFVLDEISPIKFSHQMIASGEYDNSGVIVKSHDNVCKALFCLDLSFESVEVAKRNGCDTIVTHHPAIYGPLKCLKNEDAVSGPVLKSAESGINVISMHLNLDVANGGIDESLAVALGGKDFKVLDYLDCEHGYGREFSVKKQTFGEYVNFVKTVFNTDKAVCYGKRDEEIDCVASFCGGGASHAEKAVLKNEAKAQVIVTSDMPHHVIKELLENNKKIILLPHYVAEEKGFKKYFERVSEALNGKVETYYFDDERFR